MQNVSMREEVLEHKVFKADQFIQNWSNKRNIVHVAVNTLSQTAYKLLKKNISIPLF